MGKSKPVKLRKTTTQYIDQAAARHNGKYNYSKAVYTGNRQLITIICPVHGEFRLVAGNHICGAQCGKCVGDIKRKAEREAGIPTKTFINKARAKHGKRFDYSQVDYRAYKVAVTIVCRLHGPFSQTPNNHLISPGCPACARADRYGWKRSDV